MTCQTKPPGSSTGLLAPGPRTNGPARGRPTWKYRQGPRSSSSSSRVSTSRIVGLPGKGNGCGGAFDGSAGLAGEGRPTHPQFNVVKHPLSATAN